MALDAIVERVVSSIQVVHNGPNMQVGTAVRIEIMTPQLQGVRLDLELRGGRVTARFQVNDQQAYDLLAASSTTRANSNLIDDFQLGPIAPQFLLWSALLALAGLEPTSLLAGLSARIHPVDPEWVAFFEEHLPQTSTELLVTVAAVVIAARSSR